MAEQSFVNCTSGGPIRVHVEDGKIVRVRPLVFDDDDAASWSLEVDGRGVHAAAQGLRRFLLADRTRARLLGGADPLPDEAGGLRPERGAEPAEPRQVRLRADQLGRGARPGLRRDEAHPRRVRARGDHVAGLLAPQLGQPRLPVRGLGPVLQPHRVHRHPRQPRQLGRLALGRDPRLRLLVEARQPGALRPARGRAATHRADHPLGQRPRLHARHLRRQRVRAVAAVAQGAGQEADLHRPLLQLHRRARRREVDLLPSRHRGRHGARHRPRLDHRGHLRRGVRGHPHARVRGLPRVRAGRGRRRGQDAGLGGGALRRPRPDDHRAGPGVGLPPDQPGRRDQGRRGRGLQAGLRHRERPADGPAAGHAGPGQAGRQHLGHGQRAAVQRARWSSRGTRPAGSTSSPTSRP